MERQGLVIVHTGEGKGKTTAALGLALRAWGGGFRVLILQFIKGGWTYGELDAIEKLKSVRDTIEVRQCGLGFTKRDEAKKPEHIAAAKEALREAEREISSGAWDLIILDEINYAVKFGLIETGEVLQLIEKKPQPLHLVLTGRDAQPEVVEAADLVTEMRLVKHPFKKGIKAQTGLYMLVAQAVRAYEIFMDTTVAEGTVDRVYGKVFSSKQNIVLTGMPGSGKTTIGRMLANQLNRGFIDTDELIVNKAGCAISEIFAKHGETYFRDLETEIIKEIAPRSGCVIATGGGAVLRPENVEALKMNGKLYFLDRDPALLIPTEDRPLASSEEALLKRNKERYGIYRETADETVPDNDPPEAVAAETERRHFL